MMGEDGRVKSAVGRNSMVQGLPATSNWRVDAKPVPDAASTSGW
jgi:hypothetical protein